MQQLVASSVVYPSWTQSTGDTAGVMIESALLPRDTSYDRSLNRTSIDDDTPATTNEVKGVYKSTWLAVLSV